MTAGAQDFSRRDFLKVVGAGAAAATAVNLGLDGVLALQRNRSEIIPRDGPESWGTTLCQLCRGGCGVKARKIGERVVKLEGNPMHPVNQGGLCPVGQAALELLYNPDRLKSPLKRSGERGAGKWQSISWEDAIGLIVAKLKELEGRGEARTLAVLCGADSELANRLTQRFLQAYGSPNFIVDSVVTRSYGQEFAQGVEGRLAYDLENSEYILSFGAPLVEGWMSPVRQMRAIAELHRGRPGQRGRLVQVESRLSPTAAKADEWVPVRPGTELFLALGIAQILGEEDGSVALYNAAFVDQHVAGFYDCVDGTCEKRQGLRALLEKQFRPDKVAAITGVSPRVIARLANEFAKNRPSVAIPGDGLVDGRWGALAATAVQTLNALVGNIDQPGGVLVRPDPPVSFTTPVKMAPPPSGTSGTPALETLESLATTTRTAKPLGMGALIIVGSNPLFSHPYLFGETFKNVPFLVSFSAFMDESAQQADLVLPDCTPLERWDLQTQIPGFPLTVVGVSSPVIAPVYGSKPAAEVILGLAHAMGGKIADSLPWKEPEEALRELTAELYHAQTGMLFSPGVKPAYSLPLAVRGPEWQTQRFATFEDFFHGLATSGGWVDPGYEYGNYARVLKTNTGKFELSSVVSFLSTRSEAGKTADDDGYPFFLHLFKPLAFVSREAANAPFLQEIACAPQRSPWDSCVEMNPTDAAKLGIRDGDAVCVESSAGRLKTRARLFAGAMPGVINIPLGQGHTALGRWAKGRGVNPLRLIREDGGPTRVRVYKT